MKTFKIVRMFRDDSKQSEVIKTDLTLKEAQEHCQRDDTHEKDSEGNTIWFDGYTQE